MLGYKRSDRVGDQIRLEIADILSRRMKDPRVGFVTLTTVDVTADLKQTDNKEGTTRLAVYGSVDFASNRELEGTYYNRDLLTNTIDWLGGQAVSGELLPRDTAVT